jgi:CDP-paratose 2-epimerase
MVPSLHGPVKAIADALQGATVVVTGGAGFVGAHVAIALARSAPGARVIAVDNLRRRGSELNLPRLAEHGVAFVHGDVRNGDDLALPGVDVNVLIECSAEPSVLAGRRTSPHYVIDTNLRGTVNCLELARRHRARLVFLSTSRVYAIAALNRIAVVENETRFDIAPNQEERGVSSAGVSEDFSLVGARSLYGATKLASELLLHEYGAAYGLEFVIDRLGVIAGPGQMGTEEQGVFTHWMARHCFGGELTYKGWGGAGKQVRDLVHVDDVWKLIQRQLERWDSVKGRTYNAGGGPGVSLSLVETTRLCQEIAGRRIPMHSLPDTDLSDVRVYATDNSAITADTGWRPARDAAAILSDIHDWMHANERQLASVFRPR